MSVTPEDIEAWESLDKDVREEVIGLIEMCRDSSEMNDVTHPKSRQYNEALVVVAKMLGG